MLNCAGERRWSGAGPLDQLAERRHLCRPAQSIAGRPSGVARRRRREKARSVRSNHAQCGAPTRELPHPQGGDLGAAYSALAAPNEGWAHVRGKSHVAPALAGLPPAGRSRQAAHSEPPGCPLRCTRGSREGSRDPAAPGGTRRAPEGREPRSRSTQRYSAALSGTRWAQIIIRVSGVRVPPPLPPRSRSPCGISSSRPVSSGPQARGVTRGVTRSPASGKADVGTERYGAWQTERNRDSPLPGGVLPAGATVTICTRRGGQRRLPPVHPTARLVPWPSRRRHVAEQSVSHLAHCRAGRPGRTGQRPRSESGSI